MLQYGRKLLRANLAQARCLLADASAEDDPIGAQQLGHLVAELQASLHRMPAVTSIDGVVGQVADTLSSVATQDDMLFDGAVAEIDDRQRSALTDFFKLLDTEGATVRIVEGERDFELDQAAVQRARHRVENLRIAEDTVVLEGQIIGWTDHSARFELRLHASDALIQGGVAPAALDRVAVEGVAPYHQHVRATIKCRQMTVGQRPPRSAYTLMGLETIHPPAGWSRPPLQRTLG